MPGMKTSATKSFRGFRKNASLDNLEDIKDAVNGEGQPRYTQPKYQQSRPVEQPQYQQSRPVEQSQPICETPVQAVEHVNRIFDKSSIAIILDNSIEKFYLELSGSPVATKPYLDKMPDRNDNNLDMIMSNVQQHLDISGISNRLPNDVVDQYRNQNTFWNDFPENNNNGLPNYETSRKTSLNMEVI